MAGNATAILMQSAVEEMLQDDEFSFHLTRKTNFVGTFGAGLSVLGVVGHSGTGTINTEREYVAEKCAMLPEPAFIQTGTLPKIADVFWRTVFEAIGCARQQRQFICTIHIL